MANKKISELTALLRANVGVDDVLAIVDDSATETKKIKPFDLVNLNDFDTVADLVADTRTSLGDTGDAVYAQGFRYTILDSSGDLTTAGGVELQIEPNTDGSYHILQWNPNNDGTTDDSTAVQAAFDKIRTEAETSSGGTTDTVHKLKFSGTHLSVSTGITFVVTKNIVEVISFDFTGSTIESAVASGDVIKWDTATNDKVLRCLEIISPRIVCGGNEDNVLVLNGGADGSQSIYRSFIWHPVITNVPAAASGIAILNNVFEIQIYSPDISCNSRAANTYCIELGEPVEGNVSSIDIYGGTLFQGYNNVYSDTGGVKIYGGTYLDAGSYAVELTTSTESAIFGLHVERAQMDAVSNHGIFISGQGFISGCFGTSNNGNYTTLVRAFATGTGITVTGCTKAGEVVDILESTTTDNSDLVRTDAAPSEIVASTTERESVIRKMYRGGVENLGATVSGAISVDMDNGDTIRGTITGNVTVSNPTNVIESDDLFIRLSEDGVGGHTIGFGSNYDGVTAATTTASTNNVWHFRRIQGRMVQISHNTY